MSLTSQATCLKLNHQLYLTEHALPPTPTLTPTPTHHLWLIDRSGSMYSYLPQVIADLKQKVTELPFGAYLSFGYFSGAGQYAFPIKGFKLTNESDYAQLHQLFDQHQRTLGLTCFSEILQETEQVIADLSMFTNRFALWLLTDGYPVVGNVQQEVQRIEQALKRLNSQLTCAQFVGYGDYYNRDLMTQMAEWSGGQLKHSHAWRDTAQVFTQFLSEANDSQPRLSVDLPPATQLVFTLVDQTPTAYSIKDQTALINPASHYYTLSSTQPVGSVITSYATLDPDMTEGLLSACYGAAILLSQRQRTQDAIDALATIGDRAFIDRLNSAFTTEECGVVESELSRRSLRYQDGKDFHYKPADDALCVLDLLDLLLNDPEARFWPQHPEFQYKRIGAAHTVKTDQDYPTFSPHDEGAALAQLTWHQAKLNLSALVKINGTLDLPDADTVALPSLFHTYIWRNYTIIRDGALWTKALPVSCSQATWTVLRDDFNLIPLTEAWAPDKVATLHLGSLPLINRQTANLAASVGAKQLATLTLESLQYGAQLKVYKQLLADLQPETAALPPTFTPEQQAYLEAKGVTKNGFAPPTESAEPTDAYSARTFKVSAAGWSSLPKVSEVLDRIATGKKLNAPAQAMANAYALFTDAMAHITNDDLKVSYLQALVSNVLTKQRENRNFVQRLKLSVLLGRAWFPEFPERGDNTLDLDGTKVTFELGETVVKF